MSIDLIQQKPLPRISSLLSSLFLNTPLSKSQYGSHNTPVPPPGWDMFESIRLPMGDISVNVGSTGVFVNGKKMKTAAGPLHNFAITHATVDSQPTPFFTPLDPAKKGQHVSTQPSSISKSNPSSPRHQSLPGFTEVFGPREALPSPNSIKSHSGLPLAAQLPPSPLKPVHGGEIQRVSTPGSSSTLLPRLGPGASTGRKRKSDSLEELPPLAPRDRHDSGSSSKRPKSGVDFDRPESPITLAQPPVFRGDLFDVSNVHLSGEETDDVRVFDTCDTVRRRIREFLAFKGVSQAAFLRAAAASYTSGRKFQGAQLHRFLAMRGPSQGNTSGLFYGSYVFFEKLRVRDNRAKSPDRVAMEREHPDGFNVSEMRNRVYAFAGEKVDFDKYGKATYSGPSRDD